MRALLAVSLLFLLVAPVVSVAEEWTVTTLGGRCGPGSRDGQGRAAAFNQPELVAVDAAGNVYVADNGNLTVRKITPAGDVFTMAGLAGQEGYVDAPRSAARFYTAEGLAVDANGNVYVSDGARVRRITPAGVVSTFADPSGGVKPGQIAIDSQGNLYVVDNGNIAILKITTGAVTTTVAAVPSLHSIAIDSAGDLYYFSGCKLQQRTPAGVVTTIAGSDTCGDVDGSGSAAQLWPDYLAVDGSGNVYLSSGMVIRKITPTGGVTTIAGLRGTSYGDLDGQGSSARFAGVHGLAADAAGNVYVADALAATIRKVAPNAAVTTLAGNGAFPEYADGPIETAHFDQLSRIALDSSGNVFVSGINESGYTLIRKLSASGVVSPFAGGAVPGYRTGYDGTGGAAAFFRVDALAMDGAGILWAGDSCTLRKITSLATVTTVAGQYGVNQVVDGNASSARFAYVRSLATDSSGNVYIGDDMGGAAVSETIRKMGTDGMVSTLAGLAGSSGCVDGTGSAARFGRPWGVASDASGDLYVADTENDTVRKIASGGVVTTLAGQCSTSGSSDGTGSAALFSGLNSIATDPSGNVFVSDDSMLRKITPSGVVTTVAGTPYAGVSTFEDGTGAAAGFGYSDLGLASDRNGVIYIADQAIGRIRTARPAIADAATATPANPTLLTSVQLDTNPQTATSWSWSIVRRPVGSMAQLSSTTVRNPTFVPDVADLYTFELTAASAAGIRISTVDVNVAACSPLSKVIINISGNTTICDRGTGVGFIAYPTGGGTVSYQWGWRSVSGGPITNIDGATSRSYLINGATLGISGQIYIVCIVTPQCGSPMTSNEIWMNLSPTLCNLHGDANGDHYRSVPDILYLVNYLFAGGPAPIAPCDVNADGYVNGADVFYLIKFLFAGGPAPL